MQNSENERRDYTVMLGREVWSERAWRIRGERWWPARFVAELDAVNGEPLA